MTKSSCQWCLKEGCAKCMAVLASSLRNGGMFIQSLYWNSSLQLSHLLWLQQKHSLDCRIRAILSSTKRVFFICKRRSSEIEVIEEIFPGLGVRLHFTMDDHETPELEHSLTSWPDAVMVLSKCFKPGCWEALLNCLLQSDLKICDLAEHTVVLFLLRSI